jgi:hypothetical protein
MTKPIFELIENSKDQVVLKVNADDALVVALNPFLQSNYAYVTVLKKQKQGSETIEPKLIIVFDDGTTKEFKAREMRGSYTQYSEATNLLIRKVLAFLEEADVNIYLNSMQKPYKLFVTDYSAEGTHFTQRTEDNTKTQAELHYLDTGITTYKKFDTYDEFVEYAKASGMSMEHRSEVPDKDHSLRGKMYGVKWTELWSIDSPFY